MKEKEHLNILQSAISDVGFWTWWTANLPETFQVEFGGAQLWNPPTGEGKPPSGQIALRFRKPRLVYFLTFSTSVDQDWSNRLQRDELKPLNVDHDFFTLSALPLFDQILKKAIAIRSLVGDPAKSLSPTPEESFIAFEAGDVGLVVVAEAMGVFTHRGELDQQAVLDSNRQWWDYWRQYWRSKKSSDPMPHDYACEVTIPMASDD